jgi:hypothetical protein
LTGSALPTAGIATATAAAASIRADAERLIRFLIADLLDSLV